MPTRPFPPPWSVDELDACFVVKDGGGQSDDERGLPPPRSGVSRSLP